MKHSCQSGCFRQSTWVQIQLLVVSFNIYCQNLREGENKAKGALKSKPLTIFFNLARQTEVYYNITGSSSSSLQLRTFCRKMVVLLKDHRPEFCSSRTCFGSKRTETTGLKRDSNYKEYIRDTTKEPLRSRGN